MNNTTTFLLSCFLLSFLFFPSCDNTLPVENPEDECVTGVFPEPQSGSFPSARVWIVNEGNFQWGNATLDWYDPVSSVYHAAVFDSINQQPLGDVFQSITFSSNKAFLVINNSGKIEVLDQNTGEQKATISGLTSPRYFLPVSDNKAYVSDLYADAISVVDLDSYQVTGSIPLKGWSEQMLLLDSIVYVCNIRTEYLYLIDSGRDEIVDSIRVSLGSSQIVRDAEGMLWVGCDGDPLTQQAGELVRIDPQSREVLSQFEFQNNERASRLSIGPDGRHLYFLNDGCFVLPIDRDTLPECPLIPSEGSLFYGLGTDPENGDIYLTDAIDYVQRGAILRYRKSGEFVEEFLSGIIPGDIVFE